jgi:hypothetical protein
MVHDLWVLLRWAEDRADDPTTVIFEAEPRRVRQKAALAQATTGRKHGRR